MEFINFLKIIRTFCVIVKMLHIKVKFNKKGPNLLILMHKRCCKVCGNIEGSDEGRVEICRDRHGRRLCKFFASFVKFPRDNTCSCIICMEM